MSWPKVDTQQNKPEYTWNIERKIQKEENESKHRQERMCFSNGEEDNNQIINHKIFLVSSF